MPASQLTRFIAALLQEEAPTRRVEIREDLFNTVVIDDVNRITVASGGTSITTPNGYEIFHARQPATIVEEILKYLK
jgi:hypothetical protein